MNNAPESQLSLITSLYEPHVVINWRDRPEKPFNVNIHLLKSGAGDAIGQYMFPKLTGNNRSRAILNVTSKVTAAINATVDQDEHSRFIENCNGILNVQIGSRKPTPKELYDFNEAFTKDLTLAGFMPTKESVEDIVVQLIKDGIA